MGGAVVHFEIGGPDADVLAKFYEELFGWDIDRTSMPEYPMVYRMPKGIGGGIPKSQDGSPFITFYVTCDDDVAGKLAEAESKGATVALPTMDVPGGPTIAAFKDPDGNLIGLVNGSDSQESPREGKGAALCWFEISGADGDKTQAFYSDLFGWSINADNPMKYGETKAVGNGVGGGVFQGPSPYVGLYAAVDDLQATLDKAESLGGKTVHPPQKVPGGPELAHFTDPAGNSIGILIPERN